MSEDIYSMTKAGFHEALRQAKEQAFAEGQLSGMRHASRVIAADKIGHPELPGPISPNPYALEGGKA